MNKIKTTKKSLAAEITLAEGVTGKLVWKRKEFGLRGGKQVVE